MGRKERFPRVRGDFGTKCKNARLHQPEKCGPARALEPQKCESARALQPKECESPRALQPKNFSGSSSECDDEQLEDRLQGYAELLGSQPSRVCVREVKKLQYQHLYIGRGASHLGCGKSPWANPFQVKRFGLDGAIRKYEAMLRSTPTLLGQLDQLSDKVLLCHCETSEPCHGDILIKAWKERFLDKAQNNTPGEAAGAEELLRAARLRETVEEPESQSEDEPGQATRGSGWRGQGPPMMIGRGSKAREMHDGAGLCSPGRWAPEQRRLPENTVLSELRGLLKQHVVRYLGADLFARLACGKVKECSFDEIEQ